MNLSYLDLIKEDNPISLISRKAYEEAAKQTEITLLSQLNELIKRGLLVVEETHPLLIMTCHTADQAGYEVRMERGVRLVLKDQEYVESLEKKVADLTNRLLDVNSHFEEVNERLAKITVAMKQNKE